MTTLRVYGDPNEVHYGILHELDIPHHIPEMDEVDGMLLGTEQFTFRTWGNPKEIANRIRKVHPGIKIEEKRWGFWVEI